MSLMDLLVAHSSSRVAREEGGGVDGTCPNCRTDEKVEVFEMAKVPKGQVVIKVEGEEGGSGGEEEGKEERRGVRRKRAREGHGERAGLVCVCTGRIKDPAF